MAVTDVNYSKYSGSTSPIAAFIKTAFPQRVVDSLVDYETPFAKAVQRKDDLDGDGTVIPMHLDDGQGLGAQLGGTNGIARASSVLSSGTKGAKLVVTSADFYALLLLDGKTMLRMRKDVGAFFRNREREIAGKLAQMGRDLERAIWDNSAGSAGSMAVLTADPGTGSTLTMSTADVFNLHEGMWIEVLADNGSGLPDSATVRTGGPHQIGKIDYEAGTITTTGSTFPAAVIVGDHVVRAADYDRAVTASNRLVGIPTWIPSAAPSDTIFGLNRSNYSPQKVGGHRQSWLGSIEETAKKLDATLSKFNKQPKTLWLAPSNFNRLDMELGARGIREEDGGEGVFGRASLRMVSPNGTVVVKTSPYVPESAGFLLDMETWELHTLGGNAHIVMDDGNSALRAQNVGGEMLDALEIRMRFFANLVCTNPFGNGRFTIS